MDPSTVTTDDELYRQWWAGDRNAGSRLVDRHVRPVARFFANKIANAADADELVAQTFEIVARKLGDFASEGSFRSYVFALANNVLRNYLKKQRRNGREVDPEIDAIAAIGPSVVTAVASRREHQLLLHGLRAVPIDDQVLLELSYFEQLSRTEIAAALGWPVGTVASRMRRAHARLEAALATCAAEPALLQSTIHGIADWAAELRQRIADDYGAR
jgi:RNA polymerase sigma factor (sigma-70 family)